MSTGDRAPALCRRFEDERMRPARELLARMSIDSPARIVEWVRGTGPKPFVEPLPEAERRSFRVGHEACIAQADAGRADGKRRLRFPRMFIVARRTS